MPRKGASPPVVIAIEDPFLRAELEWLHVDKRELLTQLTRVQNTVMSAAGHTFVQSLISRVEALQ